ncbi:MAG: hypothetical protein KJO85_05955, partial [Gammaproteobacteria bacterium]|nr:hypothetical protein [Gammaproteobacteria bacterium]
MYAAETVTTVKDESGWKLQVNGRDHYIKGVVWGYTPRNENYTYNLWGESDDFIRKVLDYDYGLMKAAGVNTVRSFAMVPPKWVTYIYKEHGIMSVINPLMGRYGATIGGKWVPFTDYSDPLTRETLKAEVLSVVETYKNTPGVIMFALGNESNYGLSWSSFEIENLPEGEQNTAKARYLYSLYNEVISAGKKIAPNHPFSIVNGDIQYIDLIAEYCKDLDVLGVNAYRGPSFTGMWADVENKLDLPIVFFEFGSDAFNARSFQEDQLAQASILKDQWQEMYNKAAGNGEEGNSIGGFVFEWRDEWWKYLQVERLDKQDNNASWSNQAYLFDWAPGKNNMNEEWFGITALGTPNADGVYTARPRMAYDVLSEVWSMDPYMFKKDAFNQAFADMNMEFYELKGEVRLLKSENNERKQTLTFEGGSFRGEFLLKGREQDITENGENGVEFSDGQMAFLDFGFAPNDKIEGQFTVNVLGNVADTEPLEFRYGRRGLPVTLFTQEERDGEETTQTRTFNDRQRVEIYDFDATYVGENFDLTAFYHTPRYHWGYEGDFYGLLHEATDIQGMDIWNAKAPEGVELEGKGKYEGLKILAGPQVHWGANPRVMFKYESTIGKLFSFLENSRLGRTEYAFIHSEDVARRGEAAGLSDATERQSRQTTLYTKTALTDSVGLELGAIMASTEKVDDPYTRFKDGEVIEDEIEFQDTLGIKAKLSFEAFGTLSYIRAEYAGLVADGGNLHREFGTRLPYSGLGNKEVYEAGMMMNFGNIMVFPRVLYRDNLVHANPNRSPSIDTMTGVLFPGLGARNRDDDPFAVLGNREARSAEIFLTYDPTGATPFYAWDNDWREDAGFAFNIGANYTEYPTRTDANLYYEPFFESNLSFGRGLPAEDVWALSSRMVFNPNNNAKYITRMHVGFDQSTGEPEGGTRKFYEFHGKAVLGRKHILSGYFKKDAWGPYDFHRQFNNTFPEQYKIDYSILLDQIRDELRSTRIGVRALYRTTDENSPPGE